MKPSGKAATNLSGGAMTIWREWERSHGVRNDFGEHLHEMRRHRRVKGRSSFAEHLAEAAVTGMTGGDTADFECNDDVFDEELGGPYVHTTAMDEYSFGGGGLPADTEPEARPRVMGTGEVGEPPPE